MFKPHPRPESAGKQHPPLTTRRSYKSFLHTPLFSPPLKLHLIHQHTFAELSILPHNANLPHPRLPLATRLDPNPHHPSRPRRRSPRMGNGARDVRHPPQLLLYPLRLSPSFESSLSYISSSPSDGKSGGSTRCCNYISNTNTE